jgi:large subunit ribosomal protein L12
MEYVYAGMLLHAAKKPIEEKSVISIMEAAGFKPDAAKVKALVASLKDVNIEEAIKSAAIAPAVAPAAADAGAAAEGAKGKAKPAESEEDKKKSEEEAASGLAGLFG